MGFRFNLDFFIHYVESCVRETGVIIHRYRGLSVLRHMESTALRLARRRRGGDGGDVGFVMDIEFGGACHQDTYPMYLSCIVYVSCVYLEVSGFFITEHTNDSGIALAYRPGAIDAITMPAHVPAW